MLFRSRTQSKYTNLERDVIMCPFKMSDCYLVLKIFDPSIHYHVHSPYEVITKDAESVTIGRTDEVFTTFNVEETT